MEVILEANKVALHLVKVITMIFEILLLLLGNLLAESNLLHSLFDCLSNTLILIRLLRN